MLVYIAPLLFAGSRAMAGGRKEQASVSAARSIRSSRAGAVGWSWSGAGQWSGTGGEHLTWCGIGVRAWAGSTPSARSGTGL